MPIVGGLDIHRKQLTFDYPGTVTGEVSRGQIAPADRVHLRAWLARFAGSSPSESARQPHQPPDTAIPAASPRAIAAGTAPGWMPAAAYASSSSSVSRSKSVCASPAQLVPAAAQGFLDPAALYAAVKSLVAPAGKVAGP